MLAYRVVRKKFVVCLNRFVAHVSVTDDDGGDNGRVMCWLDSKMERDALGSTGLPGRPRSDTQAPGVSDAEGMKV